ncbi:transcriptional regulator [Catenovulum agarivorans DS-2]|uniref:Transcriptional regulator n=1 Tax=Catenovulum agarivorans DS-2 TaxID=1328313 RepID=W7QQZ4_9ALTE|nr:LysR family transcriptional regulator [Catenovulum agarivorans]EWH11427.1 transcriptional regulator [Catenovulum agarivorans DS-2]
MDTTSRILMFLEVVEQGSFAKVAERRNIDRSVVSKQMNKLEDDLGVRLLNRTTRSFSLTAAGSEMLKKAKELRELLGETLTIAQNYHTEPKGLLKVTSSTIIGKRYILPVAIEFQQRFPQVEVEIRLEDRLVDVVGEGYDLAFRVGPPRDSSLISRAIARNRMLIVAAPKFLETYGEPKTMQQLAKLPAATYASDALKVSQLPYYDSKGNETTITINSQFRANDGDVLISKAISGTAYCAVPAFVISDEVMSGRLVPILTHVKLPDYHSVQAVYPHRGLPVRTQLFFEAVRDFIGKETPNWEKNIPDFDKMYGFEVKDSSPVGRWTA